MNDYEKLEQAKLGAICGDVAGSIYEWGNIKFRLGEDQLIRPESRYTDDTVMTCAVARGFLRGFQRLPQPWWKDPDAERILLEEVRDAVAEFGLKYPDVGYGSSFIRWLHTTDHAPYNSWGNGSAMRASYAGWFANSLEEAEKLAEISAAVTHNHPEGIKGAKAVAGSIYLLRTGQGKEGVRDYVSQFYDLNFTIDGIRDGYTFDVSCQGSVPQGIQAFLEEDSFWGALSSAISIGGDSDTLAAIAGSLAEVIYPISQQLRRQVISRLDDTLLAAVLDGAQYIQG